MRSVTLRSLAGVALLAAFAPISGAAETPCNTGTVFAPMWTACQGAFEGKGSDFYPANPDQALQWMQNSAFAAPNGGDGYWRFLNNTPPSSLEYWNSVMGVVKGWKPGDFDKTEFGDDGHPNPDAGPFAGFDYDTGTLRFRDYYSGVFAVLLKGSTFYSVYLFDLTVPTNYITDIDLRNALHAGGSLSHAAIIGGTRTTVPEPSSMLLLASGLLGMGFVGYRRRRK